TQTAGAEATRQRIEDARSVLAEYYRHTRDSLVVQRQEMEQLQSRQEQQRNEFHHEREQLVTWVTDQEQQFRQREQKLLEQQAAFEAREQGLRALADRWTQEKLQAETVIRDLLRQLADREQTA